MTLRAAVESKGLPLDEATSQIAAELADGYNHPRAETPQQATELVRSVGEGWKEIAFSRAFADALLRGEALRQ